MSSLFDIAPNLRRPIIRWPDAHNLKARFDELSESYGNGSDSIVEHCKAYLETVSITLVNEFGGQVPTNANLTEYVEAARDVLGIKKMPGASQINDILRAQNKMTDALNALRNQEGVVAHGKDGYLAAMSANCHRVYVLTADSIVALLLDAYEGKEPSLRHTRDAHNRFGHLNSRINSGVIVESGIDEDDGSVLLTFNLGGNRDPFTLRAPPSQILFDLDREAYLEVLKALDEATIKDINEDEPEDEVNGVDVTPEENDDTSNGRGSSGVPLADLLSGQKEHIESLGEYEGKFSDFIHPLYSFLYEDLQLKAYLSADGTLHLTRALLWGFEQKASPDWEKHENATARIRALLKRIFRVSDLPPDITQKAVHGVVDWLKEMHKGVEV
jgi:hypothetical protein